MIFIWAFLFSVFGYLVIRPNWFPMHNIIGVTLMVYVVGYVLHGGQLSPSLYPTDRGYFAFLLTVTYASHKMLDLLAESGGSALKNRGVSINEDEIYLSRVGVHTLGLGFKLLLVWLYFGVCMVGLGAPWWPVFVMPFVAALAGGVPYWFWYCIVDKEKVRGGESQLFYRDLSFWDEVVTGAAVGVHVCLMVR